MKRKIAVSALMVATLSACSTTGYTVAPGKETASLRVVSMDSGNVSVWIDKTPGCINHNFIQGGEIAVLGAKANLLADRQAGRVIGMPMYRSEVHEKQQTELNVEANVPISFYFAGVWVTGANTRIDGYRYCVKEVSFTPLAGHNYEAQYYVDKIDGKKQCTITLYDIKQENGEYVKTESEHYELTTKPCDN
ncbi:hypothetical protein PRUB_b0948 [Pseudoalteromonas rubra]|uniref:Lipoprotein n=1 Tax=Pseudoalteromonas rubra TaxID=43658 RepID=A0A8T0C348_9GAMM|nr:hypothetical protein [Pseudoalteromonas rubra]KAF7781651.1 hypothetical protein PRUB_b0948 [Pseudoalteromonas rubra]